MASFNSPDGRWFAAKEKVAVTPKAGEPYIYDGLDREALELISTERGVSIQEVIDQNLWIGMKIKDDPQIMQLARDRGMTLEQYLEANKPTAQQAKVQEEAQSKTVTHTPDKVKNRVEPNGSLGGFASGGVSEIVTDAVRQFDQKAGSK